MKIRHISLRLIAFGLVLICLRPMAAAGAGARLTDSTHAAEDGLSAQFHKGERLQKAGDFAGAAKIYEETSDWARRAGRDDVEIECQKKLGIVHWDLGDLASSRKAFGQGQALSRKAGNRGGDSFCTTALRIDELYVRGKALSGDNKFGESVTSFEEAIELAKKLNSPDHEAKCLRQLANTYCDEQKWQPFLDLTKRAFVLYQSLNNDREAAWCQINFSIYARANSDFPSTLKYLYTALGAFQKRKDGDDEASCLYALGTIFILMGDFQRARDYLIDSRRILRKLDLLDKDYSILCSLGICYRAKAEVYENKHDLELAIDCYLEALNIAWNKGQRTGETRVLNNLSFALIQIGDYDEAIRLLRSAYARALRAGDAGLVGRILTNEGHAFYSLGKVPYAMQEYSSAIKAVPSGTRPDVLWESYWGLGRCLVTQHRLAAAEAAFNYGISLVEFMRNKLNLETDKAGFVRDKLEIYESLIDLLYSRYRVEPQIDTKLRLFNAIERAKARAFLDKVHELAATPQKTIPSNREDDELSRQISVITCRLAQPGLSPVQREKLEAELGFHEDRYLHLVENTRANGRRALDGKPVTLAEIQKYLGIRKTAILEYFLGEEHSYSVFLSGDSCEFSLLPPRKAIENSIKLYIKLVSSPQPEGFRLEPASRRISKELLFPLEGADLEKVENLVIVPDGLLYYLPFETLTAASAPAAIPLGLLMDRFRISYAHSASSLWEIANSRRESRPAKALLAVGDPDYQSFGPSSLNQAGTSSDILRGLYLDEGFSLQPLPYTRDEVQRVARFFPPGRADVLIQGQATEEAVKAQRLADYRIIHFACHGLLDERFPLRSALVFARRPGGVEDGFLQAREIYDLTSRADLVVLSACQTGRGLLERGEGPIGLARVFFYIGAKSVVSTLWPVCDRPASLFMSEFYARLSKGQGKNEALRGAKLALMSSGYSSPFYWAGYVLNGEYDSPVDFR